MNLRIKNYTLKVNRTNIRLIIALPLRYILLYSEIIIFREEINVEGYIKVLNYLGENHK